MSQIQRPQLTLKILLYGILDVVGMVFFATGALWLARGQFLFIAGFPGSTVEAIAATAGGLVVMLWSAAQILRELMMPPSTVRSGCGQ